MCHIGVAPTTPVLMTDMNDLHSEVLHRHPAFKAVAYDCTTTNTDKCAELFINEVPCVLDIDTALQTRHRRRCQHDIFTTSF